MFIISLPANMEKDTMQECALETVHRVTSPRKKVMIVQKDFKKTLKRPLHSSHHRQISGFAYFSQVRINPSLIGPCSEE